MNYNIFAENCQINININSSKEYKFEPENLKNDFKYKEKNQKEEESAQNKNIDDWVNMTFKHKKEATIKIQEAYRKANIIAKSARLEQCFTIAKFWQSKTNKNKIKLIYANSCRVRLCPSCAWRRSMKYYKENKEIFDKIKDKRLKYIFLTVTVKNCKPSELSEALTKITEGYHRLMKYKEVKEAVKGSIRSIEITYNSKDNTFHPHIHAILAVGASYFGRNYISQDKWSDYWAKACNIDYIPITDIRAFKQKTAKSIAEISKYVVKYSDILTIDDKQLIYILPYLDRAIANRRMISYSGVFREARQALKFKDDITEEAEENISDEGYIFLYRWHWGLNKYIECLEEDFTTSTKKYYNV